MVLLPSSIFRQVCRICAKGHWTIVGAKCQCPSQTFNAVLFNLWICYVFRFDKFYTTKWMFIHSKTKGKVVNSAVTVGSLISLKQNQGHLTIRVRTLKYQYVTSDLTVQKLVLHSCDCRISFWWVAFFEGFFTKWNFVKKKKKNLVVNGGS